MANDERYFHICRTISCAKDSIKVSFTNAQIEIEFTAQYLEMHSLLPVGPGDGLYIKGISGNGDNNIHSMNDIERIRIQRSTIHPTQKPTKKENILEKIIRLFRSTRRSNT